MRKAYRPEAPSTNAASFRSAGTAVSAPEQTRKKYGKPIHRFTISTENRASQGSSSHGMLALSIWLMMPKSVFSMPCQTSAVRMTGKPYGMMSNTR